MVLKTSTVNESFLLPIPIFYQFLIGSGRF